jgi:hypothetical protein
LLFFFLDEKEPKNLGFIKFIQFELVLLRSITGFAQRT